MMEYHGTIIMQNMLLSNLLTTEYLSMGR